uniref:AlNc14C168G7944 protein n=1 Tax=Albugo laibachii Nc14 TaxID=890382 RepID=F0WNB4_9STRA|nr:AlNc14C168G7944 [Albugo laibachii Nc14]|eukprot:CCA22803.1 AlNc14C168G7944 [Albugo laibachii Nc14]
MHLNTVLLPSKTHHVSPIYKEKLEVMSSGPPHSPIVTLLPEFRIPLDSADRCRYIAQIHWGFHFEQVRNVKDGVACREWYSIESCHIVWQYPARRNLLPAGTT